jgi:hypothetical protein
MVREGRFQLASSVIFLGRSPGFFLDSMPLQTSPQTDFLFSAAVLPAGGPTDP